MENLTLAAPLTKEQILANCGLDFTISKRPLGTNKFVPFNADLGNDIGTNVFIPSGYYGLFNDKLDKCINTCKEGYVISQNSEVLEMVLRGIEPFGNDLRISKGGALNEGRKIYLQLEIMGNSKVNGDTIKKYVTIIDSNDGSTSLSIGIGDLTMSCQNQFFKFYKQGEAKFRHSASLEQKIKTIPNLIEMALNASLEQIELYQFLATCDIKRSTIDEMVKNVIGFDKNYTSMSEVSKKSKQSLTKMDTLYNSIETEINGKGLNLWGLHSGITRFTTHEISAPNRENGKVEILLGGTGYTINQNSLNFVTEKAQYKELVYAKATKLTKQKSHQ